MNILNDNEIQNIINEYSINNNSSFDNIFIEKVKQSFKTIMNESDNINRDKLSQQSIIEDFLTGKEIGEKFEKTYMRYSGVKHMTYLDNFAEEGESTKLINSLIKNNIPLDVLKGISLNLPMDKEKRNTPVGVVEISQHFNDYPSLNVEDFSVWLNGELIYSFGDTEEEDSYDSEEELAPIIDDEEEERKAFRKRIKELFILEYSGNGDLPEKYADSYADAIERDIKETSRIYIERKQRNPKRKSITKSVKSYISSGIEDFIFEDKKQIIEEIEFKIRNKPRTVFRDIKTGRFTSIKDKRRV